MTQDHCSSCNKFKGFKLVINDDPSKWRLKELGVPSMCVYFDGLCQNGELIKPFLRRKDDHCGTCNEGYTLMHTAAKTSCAPFGGDCANGQLIGEALRRQQHHCGSCNPGFVLDELRHMCRRFGGTCSHGRLIVDEAARTKDDECGTCFAGYRLDTADSTCASTCGPGEYPNATVGGGAGCQPYGGSCINGELFPQAERTEHNKCASCLTNFDLIGGKCTGSSIYCRTYADKPGDHHDDCIAASRAAKIETDGAVTLTFTTRAEMNDLPHPMSADIECVIGTLVDHPMAQGALRGFGEFVPLH